MTDQMRSLVMVENETYELIDGDGNFYVSKANLGPTTPQYAPSTDPFIGLGTSEFDEPYQSDNNQISIPIQAITPPQANMEPILINDYGKMNFFTQGTSNVTIYLNSDNGESFMSDAFDSSTRDVIDLTTSSIEERKIDKEEDIPEFIDVSQLKLPYPPQECFYDEQKGEVSICKIVDGVVESEVMAIDDDDNDVVFVKEYKIDDDVKVDEGGPLDLRSKIEEKETPRRNPKRTVQLLKEYYSNFRYSPDSYGKGKRRRSECCNNNNNNNDSRRSQRAVSTGAVLYPPSLLTNENFKDWPTEGMHEKPVYNAESKKFENKEQNKKKPAVRKVGKEAAKKRPMKKGKRRNAKAKVKDEVQDQGISKEFATFTHETLQAVIGYVQLLKESNELFRRSPEEESRREVIMTSANDILTNSCILYSIANDVPQVSVAKYLKTLKKEV